MSQRLQLPVTRRSRAVWIAVVVALVVTGACAPALGGPEGAEDGAQLSSRAGVALPAAATQSRAARSNRPNVIFFLADDMSARELRFMPNTRRYIFNGGASFANYFTNISICCPARASIFTGQYTHNTHIHSNTWPGGFYGFEQRGLSRKGFPYLLKQSGYLTSLMGKYLNGYVHDPYNRGRRRQPTFVPPGWSDWAVPTRGQYAGSRYTININGRMHRFSKPRDFLSDYTARRAVNLIRRNKDRQGLFLELSDYGPHFPEPTSPIEKRNGKLKKAIAKQRYPRTPAFNEKDVSDKPRYVRGIPRLTAREIADIDRTWRRRLMSVRTLDRHVGQVVRALRETGQVGNTYLVFTSDNGYHLGEHRLREGKMAEFDTDIRVPLGIRGPGIRAGTRVRSPVGNIDLAPTFLQMTGGKAPATMDGESALPLARGRAVPWRRSFYVQKGDNVGYGAVSGRLEPGYAGQARVERRITRYIGAVANRWRYFVYNNGSGPPIAAPVNGKPFRPGEEAFYDISSDPHQTRNLTSIPQSRWTAAQVAAFDRLRSDVLELAGCKGAADCRLTE